MIEPSRKKSLKRNAFQVSEAKFKQNPSLMETLIEKTGTKKIVEWANDQL